MAGSRHVQGRSRLSADALTGGAAESWDRRYGGRDADAHRARSRLDATVRILGPGPGDLLDVGAGGGRLIEALRGSWWTCHAVEPVERLVDLAAHRVPEAAARLAVARAESLPFPDGSFDAVTMLGVLEHVDVDSALAEARRVLRTGGRAIVGVRSCRAPVTVWRATIAGLVGRSPRSDAVPLDGALSALERTGFAVEEIVPVGAQVLPDPLDRLLPHFAFGAAQRAERSPRLRPRLATQRLVVARRRPGPA